MAQRYFVDAPSLSQILREGKKVWESKDGKTVGYEIRERGKVTVYLVRSDP